MEKLADRLKQGSPNVLPLVLTGPILRQVTDSAVTVWVAVLWPAKVTLTVYDKDDASADRIMMQSAPRTTTGVGHNLHIVAVTARAAPKTLKEGNIYFYDLAFTPGPEVDSTGGGRFGFGNLSLMKAISPPTAANPSPITYLSYKLPSFTLPPKDPTNLRIIHGSCRMPHADGDDALSMLDDLIRAHADNVLLRPQQLLLTGDQIYADDVAAVLLMQLMDASQTLLGWTPEEVLPAFGPKGTAHKPSELVPIQRRQLLTAVGFTSDDLGSHLLSLGEYLCMYLFVWSDTLWPKALPTEDEVKASRDASAVYDEQYRKATFVPSSEVGFLMNYATNRDLDKIDDDRKDVENFRLALPAVRRALANIPTYMICDDHDVTDDWNRTRDFCAAVYASRLGRRVVQNALVAYSLCQLWGNTPEQFDESAPNSAGMQLLQLLNHGAGNGSSYDGNSSQLQVYVAVHDDDKVKMRTDKGLFHDPGSLRYNFTIEGPGHQVIVTDTRTWRSYPAGGTDPSFLLPKDKVNDQFTEQILHTPPLNTPDTPDRVLLVVVTTNAPAIEPIRTADRHPTLAHLGDGDNADLYEDWGLPSVPFDRLLATLTDKLDKDPSGTRFGYVVLLSGDVHHSFASRLVYRATARFEDKTAQPATAVFAQLVASSFKKESKGTRGIHDEGYTYAPTGGGLLVPDHDPEGYVGWNVASGKLAVGTGIDVFNLGADVFATHDEPTRQILPWLNVSQVPNYRYRLDYLTPWERSDTVPSPAAIKSPPSEATPEGRKKAAEAYKMALAVARLTNKHPGKPEVIGKNNISEITFNWGPPLKNQPGAISTRFVLHTVRWWDPRTRPEQHSITYTVSLNPNDVMYLDFKARGEP